MTAASAAFEEAVLALLGSLEVNWPAHPPVLVYDLGMSDETVGRIRQAGVEVRRVPPFCPHWRKYFTWRMWCVKDAPAEAYLWLDAGVCVLRPLEEAFHAIERFGYFCVTNHMALGPTMSDAQRGTLGLAVDEVARMVSVNGGVLGLKKDERGKALIDEAMRLALDEKNMAPTRPLHRHDQPIWTALLEQYFAPVLYADFSTYAGWRSPVGVPNQKVWVHRRRMLPHDIEYFKRHIDRPGEPRIPDPLPPRKPDSLLMKIRKKVAAWRGRTPPSDKAGTVIYDGVRD